MNTQKDQTMSTSRPFPSVTGGCFCNKIRYRLLTAPLFCCACYCSDCQKMSGSAFVTYAMIETSNISIESAVKPTMVTFAPKPGLVSIRAECPQCRIQVWGHDRSWGTAVADVRVGTLDYPSLMEPDVHAFVEGKVDWMRLPEGAKTTVKDSNYRDHWPKSSLQRLDLCLARAAEVAKRKEESSASEVTKTTGDARDVEESGGEGDKTPTGVDVDADADADADGDGKEDEDDEAFERRFRATEKALQERLERLSLKLNEDKQDDTSI
ncbi:hypothetical protein P153DRAFT_424705 [Dothidotthia symphoricarpi CBS 119687]|uniref:CENP-V/GFA domain-containing protein n=1 Tax=Dothidotthia symphoricarpi CBS 119687 TaxID=1392245 RepID=A0A6A6A7B4_9PLEO|nr:uncharacterized protein P153DRAFT_424705 [Dothidotthia symphoricarpi CBS 119687]KAF2126697.1 hypothetical protein P153DRAFT_424705 [Dothidotthia symphoricarpi CBS 119687]